MERSIKFVSDNVTLDPAPLKREEKLDEPDQGKSERSKRSKSPKPNQPTIKDAPDDKPAQASDNDGMGRGRHVWKKSAYVRHLQDGEEYTSNLPVLRGILQDIQLVLDIDEEAEMMEEWELGNVEDFAMATVMEAAEGLNPTLAEAKRWLDWPKWEEAMREEVRLLKANKTWKVVKCP